MPRRKKRVGNQKPTFERIGKYHHSDAKACINMFSHYGFKLDDAQKYELELYMAKDAKGMPAAETIGAAKPRQNGKSFAARYLVCGHLWNGRCLFSSQCRYR